MKKMMNQRYAGGGIILFLSIFVLTAIIMLIVGATMNNANVSLSGRIMFMSLVMVVLLLILSKKMMRGMSSNMCSPQDMDSTKETAHHNKSMAKHNTKACFRGECTHHHPHPGNHDYPEHRYSDKKDSSEK